MLDAAGSDARADARVARADADAASEACATSALPIELRPLDMMLAIDTSGSMDYP
ncbi:MAG: hypothetical protein IPG96_16130 [Proteobacteria bacterium]|nr:hypothetical protein [Pseudomonadota bacterium]